MSLDFSFDCVAKGWRPIFHHVGSCLNHGKSENRTLKGFTLWETKDGSKVVELLLTQNKSTLIDYDCLSIVCESNWVAAKDSEWGYRVTRYANRGEEQLLHRVLFKDDCPEGLTIDHINEDFPESYALDNRKCNIRFTSKNTHNVRKYSSNTSGHTCLIFRKKTGKLTVQVRLNKKTPYTPYYESHDVKSALKCRDMFKVILHKHFKNIDNLTDVTNKVIDLYDNNVDPCDKPERDVIELFKQIKRKGSLDLESKITFLKTLINP